jgi:hypothetical protein
VGRILRMDVDNFFVLVFERRNTLEECKCDDKVRIYACSLAFFSLTLMTLLIQRS